MINTKCITYFDMDGPLADWEGSKNKGKNPDQPGFYLNLEPIQEGIEFFKKLASFKETHEVFLLSTGTWDAPWCWTEKRLWVENHIGESAHKRLIISHRKDLNLGDFLIDDRTKNGAGEFNGKLILYGSEEFPDWKAIEEHYKYSRCLI